VDEPDPAREIDDDESSGKTVLAHGYEEPLERAARRHVEKEYALEDAARSEGP